MRRVTEDWLYAEPFWYELERRGLRVAAVDVPMTFPSRLTRGIEIINWGSHDELGPFPRSRRRSRPRSPAVRAAPHGRGDPGAEDAARARDDPARPGGGRAAEERARPWVLERGPWDFSSPSSGSPTAAATSCGRSESEGEDALLDVYRAVDAGDGRLLEVLSGRSRPSCSSRSTAWAPTPRRSTSCRRSWTG